MNLKLPISALALCAAFGLSACSSSSSSSSEDPVNPETSSAGGDIPVTSSASQGEGGSTGGATVSRLPAVADVNYPTALYPTWKGAHFITLEDEMTRYPIYANRMDFNEIFGPYLAQGLNAGRVIWSTYSDANCIIDDASGSNMYKRGCTVSEGIGYGMLVTLFAGDMDAYNRLWVYSMAYRNTTYGDGHNLMPWLTASFGYQIPDGASATDADLDIATSLVIAYYKTGNQAYLTDALTLINSLWTYEINQSNFLIYSGDTPMWVSAADPTYNLSYFSPVALRLFALVDPSHNWTAVLDAEYAYMQKVQAAGTGVLPDWSNEAGVAVNPPNNAAGSNEKTYTWYTFNKESVRIPWRLAWDYNWFQDTRDAAILNTLNTFISTRSNGDPSQIPPVNYSWDPAKADITNQTLPLQWLAAWCATGMAGADAWVDACTTLLNAQTMQTSASSYFTNMLHIMISQLLNGAYVKPANMGI